MMTGVFVDTANLDDIRRGIAQLHQWEAALSGGDAAQTSLCEILAMETGRLVLLAHEHFGTGRFTLPALATASGEPLRILHGMTGSLGRACDGRGVQVFDRHGGQPLVLSVRPQVAELIPGQADPLGA